MSIAHGGSGDLSAYPGELECDVLLSDGRTAKLRAIRPDDAPALREFGEKLSPETVYFRFFTPRKRISDEEVAHFVTVDYRDRLALVAIVDGELVAVARYDRTPAQSGDGAARSPADGPGQIERDKVTEAEVAFVVRDDQQGRGLGTVMLEHLASAAVARGIGRFVADTLADNHRMIGVFRSAGFAEQARFESGVIRVIMELAARPEYLERVEEREWTATVRSIERILRPSSIAVVEASPEPKSVGQDLVRNLLAGGFAGEVYPVNRDAETVEGLRAYRSVTEVPGPVDMALIAVPDLFLTDVVRDCGAKGVGGLVVVAGAPFAKDTKGSPDAHFERDLVELAREFGMRLVGPSSTGVINTSPSIRMNASHSEHSPLHGSVAFSSQSGSLGIAVVGELASRGLGISSFVSVGDKADVSGNDLLRFWADDHETGVILLHLESFGNPRKFSRIARRVARTKPIVILKSARTTSGLRGTRSQVGVLAVPDEAADALFRQAGVIRVETLEELLDVTELLAIEPLPAGRSVAIVGNTGGAGVLSADACESRGLTVLELAPETQERIDAVVSGGALVGNPVELATSATAEEYRSVLEVLLADSAVDAVLVTFTPPEAAGAAEVAAAVVAAASATDKPVVASFLSSDRAVTVLRSGPAKVPCFSYPESAARALARVASYAEWLNRPEGIVPVFEDLDAKRADEIVATALRQLRNLGRSAGQDGAEAPTRDLNPGSGSAVSIYAAANSVWLDAADACDLVEAYGIPILPSRRATTVAEAVNTANEMGYPVALRLDAPAVPHKSDVGGLRLGLASPAEVAAAAADLLATFGPGASILAQPMGPEGVETFVGLVEDRSFGPLVMFGMGGKEAELLSDLMWSLVPMTTEDVHDLLSGLRSSPLLTGYRGSPAVDVAALGGVLSRVARLAEDLPEVVEMRLSPVVARPDGVIALDARVRVAEVVHESPLRPRVMRTA